jgi:cell division protein FtsN
MDSTLEMAEVIERDFTKGGNRSSKKYRVKVGENEKGETPKDMGKLLGLSDLGKVDQDDKTIFTAGSYKTLVEASDRANELKGQGFDEAEVLKKGSRGQYEATSPSRAVSPKPNQEKADGSTTAEEKQPAKDVVVFRVQLGAFKNKPDREAFETIPNLFVVESGGYYRYMSGSFSTFADAAKHKVKMVVKDYKGAFVVAYKNGKRVSLQSVGVNPISSDPIIGK